MNGYNIYRAKWVLPIFRPPIEDGAVVVSNGKIIKVDSYADISEKGIQGKWVDLGERAILPALVNAHTHLELSALKGLGRKADNFVHWLKSVIEAKQKLNQQDFKTAEQKAYKMLRQTGTGLVGNLRNFLDLSDSKDNIPEVNLLEFLGFNQKTAEIRWSTWKMFLDTHLAFIPTAHAPYSVHPQFLPKIKQLAEDRNQIFSIHVAESQAEVEFLLTGKGALKDLLIEKKLWDENFKVPKKRPIAYLESRGVLNSKTLCVHCVEVDEKDASILQKYGVKVCLCPRSNAYLGLNSAPWLLFKKMGISLCLGTDSLASNTDLNLFKEMAYLLDYGPFSPSELLEMATWRGSMALGQGQDFGVLFPGGMARFLALPVKGKNLAEAVILAGAKGEITWIE